MIDLARIVHEASEAIAARSEPEFPSFPLAGKPQGKSQLIEDLSFFPVSLISLRKYESCGRPEDLGPERAGRARAREVCVFFKGNEGKGSKLKEINFPSAVPCKGNEGKADPLPGWRAGLALLSPEHPPCPTFRWWPAVYAAARRSIAEHGDAFVSFGWTTLELFGVHPVVGTIRVDCSGALMVSGGARIVEVTPDLIRYANGLALRRSAPPPASECIAVWEFTR